jgi:putative membrane protein
MTDLLLAFGHHALVFSLVALLAAELAILARPVAAAEIRLLSSLDAAYGATAGLILAVGFGRVFLGAKGAAFFLHNPLFWAKLAFFLAVGLASAVPTVRFARWKRTARADASYAPALADVASVRRWMLAELALFVPIPLLAAAMARGVGL